VVGSAGGSPTSPTITKKSRIGTRNMGEEETWELNKDTPKKTMIMRLRVLPDGRIGVLEQGKEEEQLFSTSLQIAQSLIDHTKEYKKMEYAQEKTIAGSKCAVFRVHVCSVVVVFSYYRAPSRSDPRNGTSACCADSFKRSVQCVIVLRPTPLRGIWLNVLPLYDLSGLGEAEKVAKRIEFGHVKTIAGSDRAVQSCSVLEILLCVVDAIGNRASTT